MKRQLVFKSALLVLLLVMTGQFISAQSFTKRFKNEPLTGVIKELERQTGYSFIYETEFFGMPRLSRPTSTRRPCRLSCGR